MRLIQRLRRGTRRAFTILEILIAIVVLVLGITGIVALFPTAIDSGNQTVEDSYSSAIAQSVMDAITVGIRESRYSFQAGGESWTYFVFTHDGVFDQAPTLAQQYDNGADQMWLRDYCIVLPRAVQLNTNGEGTGLIPAGNTDSTMEPYFLYPVPLVAATDGVGHEPNQRDSARLAAGQVIDNLAVGRQRETTQGVLEFWFPRVYHLGTYRQPTTTALPAGFAPGDVRQEFLGEDVVTTAGGATTQTIAADPYPNYSFAFSLQRARIDTSSPGNANVPDGEITAADQFSDTLFQVKIYVFKGFNDDVADTLADPAAIIPRSNRPIREFITLISL